MNDRKVYRYLQKLSENEWRDFEAYLESPLLGNSSLYVRFLKVLREIRFEQKSHTLVSVHEAVYPANEFADCYLKVGINGTSVLAKWREGHMKRNFSELLGKLFDFWGFQQSRADTAALHAYRLRGLALHGELADYEREYPETTVPNDGIPVCNASRLLDPATNAILMTELQAGRTPDHATNRFQRPIDLLDEGYLLAALDLGCKAYNHDNRHHEDGLGLHRPPRFLDLQNLDPSLAHSGMAKVLLPLYKMYTDHGAEYAHFQAAKSALMEIIGSRPPTYSLMLEDLMGHLINFAYRKVSNGGDEYRQELHLLYDFALLHGVFLRDGQLSWHHYQNAVNVLMKVKLYDWVADFLVAYKHQLPSHLQELFFAFNWGVLEFRRRHFKEAWQSLAQAEKKLQGGESVEFLMLLKTVQIVLEYETDDYERFHSRATNFIAWLKAERGLPRKRAADYLRFARFAKRMARLRLDLPTEATAQKWEALGLELQRMEKQYNILGDWLQEKLVMKLA
jgi:hypothetical protein